MRWKDWMEKCLHYPVGHAQEHCLPKRWGSFGFNLHTFGLLHVGLKKHSGKLTVPYSISIYTLSSYSQILFTSHSKRYGIYCNCQKEVLCSSNCLLRCLCHVIHMNQQVLNLPPLKNPVSISWQWKC